MKKTIMELFDTCDNVEFPDYWSHARCTYIEKYSIKRIIRNPPATIVMWEDGSKTVVKCMEDEDFDTEKGLAMAICKKVLGKDFHKIFKNYIDQEFSKCMNPPERTE